jgi:hypothetical protein
MVLLIIGYVTCHFEMIDPLLFIISVWSGNKMSIRVYNIIYININVMVLFQGKITSIHTHARKHTHAQKIHNHLLVSFPTIYILDSASYSHQLMVSNQKIQPSFTLQTQ